MKVDINEVPEFYRGYIQQVGDAELVPLLIRSGDELVSICKNLTENQALYRYDTDKWSIKDIIQHLIDAERVFAYRALRFSRNDFTELEGFEQDDYAKDAEADKRTLHQLLNEFNNLRASTVDFFSSINEERRKRKGVSSKVEMSVEVLGYIISGHTLHHLNVIKEKYFK